MDTSEPEECEFEWDELKSLANFTKHGVKFTEAVTVFKDELALTTYDPDHSEEEDRYITMGMSYLGRILIVSHTDRGSNLIRIISARVAAKHEKRGYEDGNYP